MIKRVDSGGQVHLVTNIRKPRKWRRYEYLESSGTLWIDTGIKTSINTKFIVTIRLTSPAADSKFIGAYIPGGVICTLANKWRIYSGNTFFLTDIATNTNKVNIEFSGNIFKVNNSSYTLGAAMVASNVNIFLFLADYKGNPTGGECAIYEYKHYEGDLLVRHMVPAEYNGEYGMWDLVEDRFYPNKGTGTFTVGPEMKNYDEIYEVRKTTSLLPAGVELYDYILSSGTLWIDTGLLLNTFKILHNALVLSRVGNEFSLISCWNGGTNLFFNLYTNDSNNIRFYSGASTLISENWNRHTYIIDRPDTTNFTVSVDGTLKISSTSTLTSSAVTIKISRRGDGNAAYSNGSGRFFGTKIWTNNQLVRNLLPCTYLGEPGMWDTVENKFYRNQGTGLFTLGNKITLKEYEYLEANKAPYIDTQFIPKGNTSVEMQLMALSSTQNNGFFGAYGSGWTDNSYGFYGWSGEKIWNNYKNDVAVGTYTSIFPINTIHKVFKDKNTLYINNRLIHQDAYTNFTAPYTLLIFDINKANNRCPAKMRLYYTKVWDNNTLVRDFIPVSYNGTPGLWDKVEWKFYANAGSGSFTLGPEKASGVYPVWTPIEYLLSTGTLYIDTGVIPNNNTKVILDFKQNALTDGFFFGGRDAYGGSACFALHKGFAQFGSDMGANYSVGDSLNRCIVTLSLNGVYIDNILKHSYNSMSFTSPKTLKLFGCELSSGMYPSRASMTVYSFKVYNSNTLIRDFIPVRIGNIGYMFDRVTGKMYGNSGTGNFILGPDINL